jgi:OOP family OmpA-OmpF porin
MLRYKKGVTYIVVIVYSFTSSVFYTFYRCNLKTTKMKRLKFAAVICALIISQNLFAQRTSDIEGGKDHPLVSRFQGSFIEFYKETKWGSYKLPVNAKGELDWAKPQILEGKVTRIQYTASLDNTSEFVLQNYKKAFTKAGFTVLIAIANEGLKVSDRPHTWHDRYYSAGGLNNIKFGMGLGLPAWRNNHFFIAAKLSKQGQENYVAIYGLEAEKYTLIIQDVIEVESVETGLVSAKNILDGISSNGHAALDGILFDTGVATIKAESAAALKNIADYLISDPASKFFIVGHTDNVGSFENNMKLSEARAKAVITELTTKYAVKPEQLKAYGLASLAPVTNNSTEESKAKNRRVEIVKQ